MGRVFRPGPSVIFRRPEGVKDPQCPIDRHFRQPPPTPLPAAGSFKLPSRSAADAAPWLLVCDAGNVVLLQAHDEDCLCTLKSSNCTPTSSANNHPMANQSCGIGCTFQLGFGNSAAGVFVSKVREGGPASVVGINAGDRLLGFFLDSKVSNIFLFPSPALANDFSSALSRVGCCNRHVHCSRRPRI